MRDAEIAAEAARIDPGFPPIEDEEFTDSSFALEQAARSSEEPIRSEKKIAQGS